MTATNVQSKWVSGELVFHEAGDYGTGANLLTIGTSTITFGSATQDVDVMIYLGAADQYVKFDAGAATMTMSKVDVNLGADLAISVEDISLEDGCSLEFGTDKDIDIQWVNASGILQISPKTDDTGSINIGDGTKDIDFKVFLGTSGKYVHYDVGNSCVTMSAGTALDVDDTTDSSSIGTGSIHTEGGLGVTKKVYVGTDLVMVAGDIDMTTAGTGTYDLKLKDSVADALSIKRGNTDMVVFDSNTPKITFTPAVDFSGALGISSTVTLTSALGIKVSPTFVPDGTRTNYGLCIGNRVTELDVTMAADLNQHLDPIQMNLNVIGANPTGSSTINGIYQNITHDTTDMSNLRLKNADWNVTIAKDVLDAYCYQGEIDYTAAGITVGGESAVLGLVMNAGADAVTGSLRGAIISMQGAGMPAGAIGLELRTTAGAGLGTGLAEGIRISGTPLPIVGIAMGNQTNNNEGPQYAFFFPTPAGADIGPCVGTVDDGDGEGSIAIKIGAATKYLKYWANPTA